MADYIGISVFGNGMADLVGRNLNYIRKDVVDNWNDDFDVADICKIPTGTVGYVAFDRASQTYLWVSETKRIWNFNPKNGKLSSIAKNVSKNGNLMKTIRTYEKKHRLTVAKPTKKPTMRRK